MGYRIVPIFVPHLGCPQECTFCNQRAISGSTREPEIDEVEKILKEVEGDFEVAFYGGSFTAICESLQNKLLDVALKFTDRIRISTRPDHIDEKTLLRLREKNVKIIELGAQSMCDNVLNLSKRGHTSNDTRVASRKIKEFGFTLGLQTMVGMLGDDDPLYTVEEICKLKPDFVRIYPLVVILDTELQKQYEKGEYQPLSVEDAVVICANALEIYRQNDIDVIRIGLNPTDELTNSKVIAGAYHPSLGQMVASQIYLKKMRELLKDYDEKEVTFGVHKSEISTAVGQKRSNVTKILEEYSINVKIIAQDVLKNDIVTII